MMPIERRHDAGHQRWNLKGLRQHCSNVQHLTQFRDGLQPIVADHDHRPLPASLPNASNERDPVNVWEIQVGNEEINGPSSNTPHACSTESALLTVIVGR